MASEGHNSGNVAAAELLSFITRVERLEEERAAIGADVKDVFGEAKGRGYCVKTIRKIIKMRKQGDDARSEEEMLLQTYLSALQMNLPGV